VQAVKDLNGEIARLAAAVSENFVVMGTPSGAPEDAEVQKVLREALGTKLHTLLVVRSGSSADPSLMLQYALQAWEIWCCTQILDKFCFGLPEEVEKWLSDVWEGMKTQELQPMSSRWRGLAHSYLRTALQSVPPLQSAAAQLPTPPASPHISVLGLLAPHSPHALLARRERELLDLNLRGVRGILSLIGGDASAHKVDEEFGESTRRIQEQALHIARVVKEGVMSGWFELVRVPGAVVPPAAEGSPLRHRRSSSGGKLGRVKAVRYDEEGMENVFRGFGREDGGVMCTVEFGLVCVTRRKEEVGDDAGVGGAQEGWEVLERRMLMKPKVLLESVEEIL